MISVLYVEDEPSLLEIGKFFLEKDGSMSVDTCLSVSEALEKIGTKRYDAIISDYAMPVMNGIEFLKTLRSGGNTTPFIIFTGRGRESVVIEALNLGADFYLEKAGNAKVQFAELMQEIRHAIQRKSAYIPLEQSNAVLNATLESINEGVLAVDHEGKITLFNKKCGSLFNIPADVLSINNDSRIFLNYLKDHLEDPDDFSKKIEEISKNPAITCKGTVQGKEGQVWIWASRVQKTGDNSTGRIWSFEDISDKDETRRQLVTIRDQLNAVTKALHHHQRELEKKEEMIQKSEELMDFYSQVTLDGIFTVIDGKIVEANNRFAEMFGYSTSELAGHSLLDVISPSSYGEMMDFIRSGSEGRYPFLALHRDGSTFPVEAFGHILRYRGYTVQLVIVHTVPVYDAALPHQKVPDTSSIQEGPVKEDGSSGPVFEPGPATSIQPERAFGKAAIPETTANEPDSSLFLWEIGDAQEPLDAGEIQPPVDFANLWEIDELIEPQKRRSTLNGISEDYHPPAIKKRCPRCGSVPFEPDGDWCDECGALMTAHKREIGSFSEPGVQPQDSASEEWHTMDSQNRLVPPRKYSTTMYLTIVVGILTIVIIIVFLIRALYPDCALI